MMLEKIGARIGAFFAAIGKWRAQLNEHMRGREPARILALPTCLMILLLMLFILFVPPYLGLSNDGSFDVVLRDSGLARLDPENQDTYFNYYERQYRIVNQASIEVDTPLILRGMIRIAVNLDTLFTRDNIFDVRWLAILYTLMYVVVIYPTMRFALGRTKLFSEGLIIAVLGVIIFADVGYVTRMASFSTQPIEMICITGMIGLLFLMIHTPGDGLLPLVLFGIAIAVLMSVNAYVGLGGFVLAALCLALTRIRPSAGWQAGCFLLMLCVSLLSVQSVANMETAQSDMDKYHTMTRGALLQSEQPEQTLAEFNISPRYSILADTYADQNYPVVNMGDSLIQEEFLTKYNTMDIVAYYARNPAGLINMVDIGVQASFTIRSEYSGNYEQSRGMLPRAKSPFMGLWSSFKERSAPRTIGFFLILALALIILYSRGGKRGKKQGKKPSEESMISKGTLMVMAALIGFSLLQLLGVIFLSGDALLPRESFLFSVCMDLMILFAFSELLQRLNIIREKR